MLFLLKKLYANASSEKEKEACHQVLGHSNQQMYWRHCIGVGSLASYIGEAVDKQPFSLGFVMVMESFVVSAILFYLASNANENCYAMTFGGDYGYKVGYNYYCKSVR
jgi:hypothetical protein